MVTCVLALTVLQQALLASAILGVMCGVLGTFVVVRRISLVGDTISHSVLPGVVLGFLISGLMGYDRNPWIILTCATVIGFLSIAVVQQIVGSTRLKVDAALGIVLSGFFGLGLFLKRSLQPHMDSTAGLDSFIFGNMATISDQDLQVMMVCGVSLVLIVSLLMRPFILISFDPLFARTLGYPVRFLNAIFYMLLSVTIVTSLQAVGVILVSAMLIIPAASAFLLTEKKTHMMIISVIIGTLASSTSKVNVANGAAITLTAAFLFGLTYFFAPKNGILSKWLKQKHLKRTITSENALKRIYKYIEKDPTTERNIEIQEYSQYAKLSPAELTSTHKLLISHDFITPLNSTTFNLTEKGLNRAKQIVRNHRLWELYLTSQADYPSDHVHDDAEIIEHLLDEEQVAQINAELNFPSTDPHGKPIPQPISS